jgi:hypothetical protein
MVTMAEDATTTTTLCKWKLTKRLAALLDQPDLNDQERVWVAQKIGELHSASATVQPVQPVRPPQPVVGEPPPKPSRTWNHGDPRDGHQLHFVA